MLPGLACLVSAALTLTACGSHPSRARSSPAATGAPVASVPGERVLSVSALPRSVPAPGPADLVAAVDEVAGAGARGAFESFLWSSLEPQPGAINVQPVKNAFSYMGNQRGFQIMLGIPVINTSARELPPDLAGAEFDAPRTESRFHALIDALKPVVNGHLAYLTIGNEVDAYLGAHPAEWTHYRAFYEDAARYAHTVLPGARVGVTTQFDGARGSAAAEVRALNSASDVVVLTYYPLGTGFRPRPPSTAPADLRAMVSVGGGKPVVIQELGYPSASALGSSEASQAAFFSAALDTWRSLGGVIPFLNVFALHDAAPAACAAAASYYGRPGDPAVTAYLCSLGLRRADGTPKPAWQAIVDGGRRAVSG